MPLEFTSNTAPEHTSLCVYAKYLDICTHFTPEVKPGHFGSTRKVAVLVMKKHWHAKLAGERTLQLG